MSGCRVSLAQDVSDVLGELDAAATIGPIAPVALKVSGHDRAPRLILQVELILIGECSAGRDTSTCPAWRLHATLASDCWAVERSLPPVGQPDDTLEVSESSTSTGRDAALGYTVALSQPPMAIKGDSGWLQYLPQEMAHAPGASRKGDSATLAERLADVLSTWLTESFPVTTVESACEAACHGPVGHFGPVEAYVLERSGQADLAVDATLLGHSDDRDEAGGEPTTLLSLYGERFGTWLLHRQRIQYLKPPRKDAPVPRQVTAEVVIAPTADALMAQCALTTAEKRLFQQAGILPHATLWPAQDNPVPEDREDETPGSRESGSTAPPSTALDLSRVPDRLRKHLQAITQLAEQGKLDATDTDLLLKTARQFSKAKAQGKPAPTASGRIVSRR